MWKWGRKMKDKIINLVGPSGSGKTTIAKELEKLGYNIIKSYTTRPPRELNEWGHIFIKYHVKLGESYNLITFNPKENTLKEHKFINISEMIAFFNDYDKNEIYFATKDQYQGKGTSIYIVDPNGARQVHENVKDAEVVTIFLMADESTRLYRMEWLDERPYPEIRDRLNHDEKIFNLCKCDYVVDGNRAIEEVLADVKEIIG